MLLLWVFKLTEIFLLTYENGTTNWCRLTEMNSKEYLEQHAANLAEKQLSQDDGDEKALQAWDT